MDRDQKVAETGIWCKLFYILTQEGITPSNIEICHSFMESVFLWYCQIRKSKANELFKR